MDYQEKRYQEQKTEIVKMLRRMAAQLERDELRLTDFNLNRTVKEEYCIKTQQIIKAPGDSTDVFFSVSETSVTKD